MPKRGINVKRRLITTDEETEKILLELKNEGLSVSALFRRALKVFRESIEIV